MQDKIILLFNKTGMTDAELAKAFGVSHGLIGHWRSGRQRPSLDNCVKIADYFKISIDDLIGRTIPKD